MATTGARRLPAIDGGVVLTVHGAPGVLDLVVPSGASARDVAAEYAAQTGLDSVPRLVSRLGAPIDPGADLSDLAAGAILVAVDPTEAGTEAGAARPPGSRRRSGPRRAERDAGAPTSPAAAWSGATATVAILAALLAIAAGWSAATSSDAAHRQVVVALLALGALLGLMPVGRRTEARVLVAPSFAAAVGFALAFEPVPERLPTAVGVAGLSAAVAAAVGRALHQRGEEGLRVWIVAGSSVFAVGALAALLGFAPPAVWATLLLVAMLAARFVPQLAVDVPDQYLIDLERLAVTAWSARERPRRRRGRMVVPHAAVAAVAERGARLVTAGCGAIAVVAAVAAPLLLATATLPLDRIGARCLVGFAGGALLLAARSYRHVAARTLLRLGGLACWVPLAVVALAVLRERDTFWVAAAAVGLAALLVVVAVALGRGWRSAWWSQRAETAEAVCGAFALGSFVVAVGLFRHLWEITG